MQLKSLIIFPASILLFIGCTKSDTNTNTNTPPPDPPGTISRNVSNSGGTVLTTINAYLTYAGGGGGGVPNGVFGVGLWLNLDNSRNFSLALGGGLGGSPATFSIANLGPVNGLGSITTYPTSGYSASTSAVQGNGYVVKFTEYDATTFQLTHVQYYRIFIEAYQISTGGGILGVSLKYQGPF